MNFNGGGNDELNTIVRQLCVRTISGTVIMDGMAPIRHLATATLRGLAGHLLTETDPDLTRRFFKPGQGNHSPAAYLFQPLFDRAGTGRGFPFRLVCWDREGEFLPALANALRAASGRPFGESGARVAGIEIGPEEELRFSGEENPPEELRIVIHTPIKLKAGGRWVGSEELTLGHLVLAAVRRLNALSEHYGSGEQLQEGFFLARASLARETGRNLRLVTPRRRSSSQGTYISLSGIVGWLKYRGITPVISNLLNTASVFHIGRHTVEGCGHVLLMST